MYIYIYTCMLPTAPRRCCPGRGGLSVQVLAPPSSLLLSSLESSDATIYEPCSEPLHISTK